MKCSRLILVITVCAIAAVFLIPFNPVIGKALKLATLACFVVAWTGLTVLSWKRKPLRIALLIVMALIAVLFLVPDGPIDPDELRRDYVRRMSGFETTKYHWGGESAKGIDCSGLPRRAFRDALLSYGVRHVNGRAIRAYIEQWWFDSTARELGKGFRGYTSPIGVSGTIKEMDYGTLAPGDVAVTADGIHMLAYVGDGRWIQADPETGAVITLEGRKGESSWFCAKVTTHQWSILTDQ